MTNNSNTYTGEKSSRNKEKETPFIVGTLNVCGLKRRCLYPEFTDLVCKYNILCVVETKLDMHDIISIQGYQFISNPRKQAVIRKSRGIGVFMKNDVSYYIHPLDSQSDYVLWLRISKAYTKLEPDIILGVCYVPPQCSKYYNDDDFSQMEQEIMSYCSDFEYVFITGDINAQTASMHDFTSRDESLDKYLGLDEETLNYFDQEAFLMTKNLPVNRVSKDTKINNTGYKIVDICKNNNLLILNGRYGRDSGIGSFTFRDQSVIDYSISSQKALIFEKTLKYKNWIPSTQTGTHYCK